MHSKIFSFSDTQKVREIDIPEWFVGSIADYYDDTLNNECKKECRTALLDDLESCGCTVDKAKKMVKITEEAVLTYFRKRYEAFKDMAASITLEDFCDGLTEYKLRSMLTDKFSWYIDSEFAGLVDIDTFMRECYSFLHRSDKNMIRFYVSDVVDYHF